MRLRDVKGCWKATEDIPNQRMAEVGRGFWRMLIGCVSSGTWNYLKDKRDIRLSRQVFADLWEQHRTLIMSRKRDTHLWKIKLGWILLEGKLQNHFWNTFVQRLNTPCRSLWETLRNSLLGFPLLYEVSLCKFVNWINRFCSWESTILLLET